MSYIQAGLSIYGVTGITGGFTGDAAGSYGFTNIRVSWLTDQNSVINLVQGPDPDTAMFNDTFTGTTGTAYTVVVPVKSEIVNINISFPSPPGTLTLETFFFNGVVTQSSLNSIQISSATGSVVFSNIDQNGTNLVITGSIQSEYNTLDSLNVNFNGDTGTNYIWSQLYQNGPIAAGADSGGPVTSLRAGLIGSTGTTGMSVFELNIPNYTNRLIQKPYVAKGWCYPDNVGNQYNNQMGGIWLNFDPISRIEFTCESASNFAVNSIFNLQII